MFFLTEILKNIITIITDAFRHTNKNKNKTKHNNAKSSNNDNSIVLTKQSKRQISMEQPKILKSENDSSNDTITESTEMLNKDKMSKSDTDTDEPVIEGHYIIAKNESTVEPVIDEVIIITDDNQGIYYILV